MYICQHPENTRIGANCNSPFHMGEFEMWMNFATWMNFAIWDKFAIWMNCNMGELHHILRCASSRTLPLRRTQKNLCHARDAIYI